MRIKLDENLPLGLKAALMSLAHDVHTVTDENLNGRDDRTIWGASQRDERFLITQDLDFSDLRLFVPGTHCGILLVRLRSPDIENLRRRVSEIFREEDVGTWKGCFVVATERKIRVLRPGS
jgi:predicted nuclease of predicted toxin-antitoxin system